MKEVSKCCTGNQDQQFQINVNFSLKLKVISEKEICTYNLASFHITQTHSTARH